MGFVGPERKIVEELEVELDQRGNLNTPNSKYNTSIPKLYAAGGGSFVIVIFFPIVSTKLSTLLMPGT